MVVALSATRIDCECMFPVRYVRKPDYAMRADVPAASSLGGILRELHRFSMRIVDARRHMTAVGQRRALDIDLTRLADASVVGSAINVAETVRHEAQPKMA